MVFVACMSINKKDPRKASHALLVLCGWGKSERKNPEDDI